MTRAISLAVLGLAACVRAAPPSASANDAERAHVELATLEHGRALLVTKCGNCHRTPMPHDHRSEEWPLMLEEMAGRAGLDESQRHFVELYLVTLAR